MCAHRYDLDLSAKPYKALRYHTYAVRGAAFHNSYPLFASSSDDGTAHVFHGRVYSDLMSNPLIVPVKILRGHKVKAMVVRCHSVWIMQCVDRAGGGQWLACSCDDCAPGVHVSRPCQAV